ncbi:hypothetical protein D3C76_1687230 [compost metagenome]
MLRVHFTGNCINLYAVRTGLLSLLQPIPYAYAEAVDDYADGVRDGYAHGLSPSVTRNGFLCPSGRIRKRHTESS